MASVNTDWTVGPHGAVETLDDGILTVSGEIVMPLGRFPRRMTAVRLSGGRSLIWSGIALPDAQMAQIEALGTPAFIVVPNPGHRLDAPAFAARYPRALVVTPPGARRKVAEVVRVDDTTGDFGDPDVTLVAVAGFDGKESALIVRRADGTTLVTNDVIGHVRHPQGLGAQVMVRLFGYGLRRPAIPRTIRGWIRDKAALAEQLRSWAELPGLTRIVPSHGEPITRDPRGQLRRLADTLG